MCSLRGIFTGSLALALVASATQAARTGEAQTGGAGAAGPGGPGRNGGAGGDFQQFLSRMPQATLAELQKGDAVMIVATEGGPNGAPTAITLLGGVEPILAAAPSGGEPMRLSPWSLGSGGGEEASQ